MLSPDPNQGRRDAAEKTRLLLADLWRRNRSVIEERMATLDRAAAARPLPEDLRDAALDASHKLSGSLGMFGFERGTLIARELEQMLEAPQLDSRHLADLTKQLREMLLPTP